ncbi:MAG: hypothetical protein K6F53_12985 [Lachnospiraceae bacterium]|nr:hypothetical protein [Lachnospiraceae bacterium]
MGFLQRLFDWKKKKEDPLYDIEDWEQVDAWNEVIYDRDDLQINDRKSREDYVRGCLEQIAEASREVDLLQTEYNEITGKLRDMEEIEALPDEEKKLLGDYAAKIAQLKKKQAGFQNRRKKMSEEKYLKMERMEADLKEGLTKLTDTENYQRLIKRDLKKLENEKQAYFYRKDELKKTIGDCRSMAVVCGVAAAVLILIMLILQYGLRMDTRIGYLAAALSAAIGITLIFIRQNDSRKELRSVEKGITRLISLQNTVKIRYVNNTHLLDYLYVKYMVSSAEELSKDYEMFLEEREERLKYESAENDLTILEKEFLHELRRFQIKDPAIWLHQPDAILDKKEMVEIRHKLIIQRQSLRRRIDYNREVVAAKAQDEIKDLAARYPKYAREIMAIVDEYT